MAKWSRAVRLMSMAAPAATPLLPQLAASLGEAAVSGGVTGVACDVNGNLYVSAASGVLVVDDTGDAMVKPIPNGASALCFGGPSFSELFVTSGDFCVARQDEHAGRPAAVRRVYQVDGEADRVG